MDQWYQCPHCKQSILLGTSPCPYCQSSLQWTTPQSVEARSFKIGIVGEPFNNDDGSSRQEILSRCVPGEIIILKHIPHPKDKNAMAVFRANGEQLGHIKKLASSEFAAVLDRGIRQDVILNSVGEGNTGLLGCTLKVTRYSDDLTWDEKQQLNSSNDVPTSPSQSKIAWLITLIVFLVILGSCSICIYR